MACDRRAIVKVRETLTAAATVGVAAEAATMVQLPAVRTVIVRAETVQTPGVEEVRETVTPTAVDEAVMIGAESPNVIAEELSVKVMVCAVFTAKVCVTGVAGLNFAACPACEAVMEQVPIVLMVTVPVGVTVHTAAELLANDTGSLLEAVATRLYGATPRATSAGFVNVMVCAAAAFGVGIFCGTS